MVQYGMHPAATSKSPPRSISPWHAALSRLARPVGDTVAILDKAASSARADRWRRYDVADDAPEYADGAERPDAAVNFILALRLARPITDAVIVLGHDDDLRMCVSAARRARARRPAHAERGAFLRRAGPA